jgi:predicted transposase YdaD
LLAEIVRAPNGGEAMVAVLRYLLEVGQTPREHLQVLSRSLGPRTDESYMTAAQILREEGRREGRAEGEAKGRAEGKAQAILAVLEARGLAITDAQRAAVVGCTDVEQLERWVRQAATVKTAEALFAATK